MRCRCKVVLALVRGTTPTRIARGGSCAKSQVYRVAGRFLSGGPTGLADRREDSGTRKITSAYRCALLEVVEWAPQDHGYRRPTWTQELLACVLAERTGVAVSVSARIRLLERSGSGLRRPKPTVVCPWKARRRKRRLRQIAQLVMHLPADEVVPYLDEVDISLNPEIGPDWTRRGRRREVLTPGCNGEALPCRCLESQGAPAHLRRGPAEEQPAVPDAAVQAGHEDLSERHADPPDPRQLRDPRQPVGAAGDEVGGGGVAATALPAAVLPGP